jgi:hypothetical protein
MPEVPADRRVVVACAVRAKAPRSQSGRRLTLQTRNMSAQGPIQRRLIRNRGTVRLARLGSSHVWEHH